jgi:cell division transport system ATP-binding protein
LCRFSRSLVKQKVKTLKKEYLLNKVPATGRSHRDLPPFWGQAGTGEPQGMSHANSFRSEPFLFLFTFWRNLPIPWKNQRSILPGKGFRVISLKNVSKIYPNGVRALNNVSLAIDPGDFVFLVGPSGAGKSTFLRILFREEIPTEGQIVIDGKDIVSMPENRIPYLRRNMGIVLQDFQLLKRRTVAENVAFGLRVIGAPDTVINDRVQTALEQVGLSHKRRMFPSELSGGEQQRVCIARAIVNNPLILVTDEPTGNLDPMISLEIMQLFLEINAKGTTVIMATHNHNLVNKLRKRVIALVEGCIVKDESNGTYAYE